MGCRLRASLSADKEGSLSLKITRTSQYSGEGPSQACRAANGLAQFFPGSHIGDLPGKFQDRL